MPTALPLLPPHLIDSMDGNPIRCTFLTAEPVCTCASGYGLQQTATTIACIANTSPQTPAPPAVTTTNGGSQASEGSIYIGLGVALVGVVLLCMVLLYLQRRRGALKAHSLLLHSALPVVPPSLRNASDTRFQLEYAPLLDSRAATVGSARSYADQVVDVHRVRLMEEMLGRGQFGEVWRGECILPTAAARGRSRGHAGYAAVQEAWSPVAVKVLSALTASCVGGTQNDAQLTQLLLEARLHAQLQHPNLVRLLAVQETVQPVMLVLELCEGGDLRKALRSHSGAGSEDDYPEAARRDMAAQVAAGMQFLHSKLCIHRDLAARNVLLSGPSEGAALPVCGHVLKLGDLGLSRVLREESDYYRVRVWNESRGGGGVCVWSEGETGLGGWGREGRCCRRCTYSNDAPHLTQSTSDDAVPIRWQCPLAVETRVYTAKSDVYSFGVLLFEIYSGGSTPYASLVTGEVIKAVRAGERLAMPRADTPLDIIALMRQCTQLSPALRPSMATIHAKLRGAWTFDVAMQDGVAVDEEHQHAHEESSL